MWSKWFVVLSVLAAVGWVRMPMEHALYQELEESQLLSPPFDMQSRASLSQKGVVASFGSLRPTLAAISVLSTTRYHLENDWVKLEEAIEDTVLLDPYNPYYWDLGAWHLAYNASSSALEDQRLPALTRRQQYREWIDKGDALYQRGVQVNPQNVELRLAHARLWASPQREQDFVKVERILRACLRECALTAGQRREVRNNLFYALLRNPERLDAAYALGLELFNEGAQFRYPSLLNGLCALQLHPEFHGEKPLSLEQLYGSKEKAVKSLRNYLQSGDDLKPMYGVRELLLKLMREW